MNTRNPDSFRVRIVRDETAEDGGGGEVGSSRIPRNTAKKSVHRETSASEVAKSPAKRLKNQSHSIDVSEMFYSGDQFTITAYLPIEDLNGDKQKRLKV